MYNIFSPLLWLVSLLPLRVLYVFSDMMYLVVRHCYRTQVVRENLRSSFPEKTAKELKDIERKFYHQFCDNLVETIKMTSMSKEEMKRRMTFSGIDELKEKMENGQKFVFVYLSHFGNWEWVSSISMCFHPWAEGAQIYHHIHNKFFNRFFLKIRGQYGGENIEMKQTLRRIMRMKGDDKRYVVGFISDQQPKWNSIHHFTPFLNHDTAVFTGTEQIARKVDAYVVYGRLSRPRRGAYHLDLIPIHPHASQTEETFLTDLYMRMLEEDIRQCPEMWLWSHKRWSRTKEKWQERQNK